MGESVRRVLRHYRYVIHGKVPQSHREERTDIDAVFSDFGVVVSDLNTACKRVIRKHAPHITVTRE